MANGHGGKRKGAGRKPGAVTMAKRMLADEAKEFSTEMLQTLVGIAKDKDAPHSARVSAASAVLDRGHGKPPVMGPGDEGEHIFKAYAWLPPQE